MVRYPLRRANLCLECFESVVKTELTSEVSGWIVEVQFEAEVKYSGCLWRPEVVCVNSV